MYYLKQPKILVNLIIMSMVWLASSFSYFLIFALINTFSQIYITGLTSSASEVLAYIAAIFLQKKFGVKHSLIISFGVSTLGGILILSWGLSNQDSTLFFVFFLLAKFGIACTFTLNMSANSYFPTLFAATAIGISNFTARLVSAFSYLVSGLSEPYPIIMFTSICGLTCVFLFFLRTEKD